MTGDLLRSSADTTSCPAARATSLARQGDLEVLLNERTSLLNAAQAILGADDRDEICRQFIIHMNALIHGDSTTLFLIDHDKQSVVFSAFYRRPEAADWNLNEKLVYSDLMAGISGQVLRTGRPVLSVSPDDGTEPAATATRRKQCGSGSLIVIPLITTTGVIGTVTAHNRQTSRVFSERDVDLLMTLARQAAAAIQRAQLTDEIRRHHDHLEDLVEERTAALSVAKKAAESANLAKSAFLANMSHELRTPLNAIVGVAEIMRRRTDSPEQIDHLAKINRASQHLLAVINDVLDVSKIEAGRLTLDELPFSLGEVLDNLTWMVGQKTAEKAVDFQIECVASARACRVLGDPQRLSQVLLNLTNNAIKFTERGRITVRVDLSFVRAGEAHLRIDVEDTGIGIEQADQERIFSAFEQADTSLSRRFGGTGLGLSISRQLIRLMGGDIRVESTPGVGSRFCLTVDLKRADHGCAGVGEAQDMPDDAEAIVRQRYAGARVLVVDDDAMNREIVRFQCEGANLTVDTAADGGEAIEMAARRTYVAIFMDVQMPKVSGLDATRQIRQMGGTYQPIIALTANAFAEDKARCLAAGMDGFLVKPFSIEDLFTTLLRVLQQQGRSRVMGETSEESVS